MQANLPERGSGFLPCQSLGELAESALVAAAGLVVDHVVFDRFVDAGENTAASSRLRHCFWQHAVSS